jgi:hypothetical protein
VKSDDLPYAGPVVAGPDLPSAPVTASTNGGEPGLSSRRIAELNEWYQDQAYRNYSKNDLAAGKLNAELRAILRKECFPEHVEIEFERVMKAVFQT